MAGDTWETPLEVFEPLHAEFGFSLDVCALPQTAKCHRYYSPENDGLTQPWAPDVCWCNPPFSNPLPWVQHAHSEAEKGATVVMLLPADLASLNGIENFLVNLIHDELVFEVDETEVPFAIQAIENAMCTGYLALFPNAEDTLPGLVEAKAGSNWAEAK